MRVITGSLVRPRRCSTPRYLDGIFLYPTLDQEGPHLFLRRVANVDEAGEAVVALIEGTLPGLHEGRYPLSH